MKQFAWPSNDAAAAASPREARARCSPGRASRPRSASPNRPSRSGRRSRHRWRTRSARPWTAASPRSTCHETQGRRRVRASAPTNSAPPCSGIVTSRSNGDLAIVVADQATGRRRRRCPSSNSVSTSIALARRADRDSCSVARRLGEGAVQRRHIGHLDLCRGRRAGEGASRRGSRTPAARPGI